MLPTLKMHPISTFVAIIFVGTAFIRAKLATADEAAAECDANCDGGTIWKQSEYQLCVIDLKSGIPRSTYDNMKRTFFTNYPREARDWNPSATKFVKMTFDPNYDGVAYTLGFCQTYAARYAIDHPQDYDTVTHESQHIVQAYKGRGEQPGLCH